MKRCSRRRHREQKAIDRYIHTQIIRLNEINSSIYGGESLSGEENQFHFSMEDDIEEKR
jgi:hypothetical protein